MLATLILTLSLTGQAAAAATDPAGVPGAPGAGTVVQMDLATQTRLGVTTTRLSPARVATGGVTGTVRVLDTAPLAQLDSDLAAAQASLAASQAEADRSRALNARGQATSLKEVEAYAAAARIDQTRVTRLQRELALTWGPAIAAMSDAARATFIDELAAGKSVLARIDSLGGQGQNTRSAPVEFQGLGAATAVVIGPARTAEAGQVSPGLLARISGPLAGRLSVGLAGTARLGGAGTSAGVIIPRSALVRKSGGTFAFVQTGPGQFQRRALVGGVFQPEGLFAPGGFRPGEPVVVTGGGALLAAEVGAPALGDDD